MSDETTTNGDFAPEGYITLNEAIRRGLNSNSDFRSAMPDFRVRNAWNKIRASLLSGKISTATLKDDGSLELLPPSFWGSRDAHSLGSEKDQIEGSLRFDFDGQAFINLDDFQRIVERHVWPLSSSETPSEAVFISYSDDNGASVPLTYMLISDAMDTYAEHRRSRIDEPSREGWLSAQEALRYDLETGRIRSYHRNSRGLVRPLRATDWRVDGPILDRVVIPHSSRFLPGSGGYVPNDWTSFIDIQTDDTSERGELLVFVTEVNSALRGVNPTAENVCDPLSSISNSIAPDRNSDNIFTAAGRPREHDRELFATIAFKILWEGKSLTQAELMRRTVPEYQAAREALGSKGQPPGETWVKERIRLLWRRLDLNGSSL